MIRCNEAHSHQIAPKPTRDCHTARQAYDGIENRPQERQIQMIAWHAQYRSDTDYLATFIEHSDKSLQHLDYVVLADTL
jgi:hypothetical protein